MKKLNILYEDKYLIIVYKRHGLLTISRDNHNDLNLYDEVKEYEKKKNPRNKIFIVHRLDKDTSGLVLFAKNEKIKYALQNNWDKVIRKYYAVVEKEVLENKTLINYLQESKTGEVFVTNNKVMGKKSITKYEVLSKNNKCSLLDIEIKTGRKNQIRVQLAYVHHPIIGDKKYGNTKNKELLLQAYYLKFNHPVDNKEIIIKTDIEKSLTSYLQ
ncbi:pseudouridine synthase [Clostridium sp. CAG:609]|nr:pseudouridine synthase [Clostridium sp. CAG:609]